MFSMVHYFIGLIPLLSEPINVERRRGPNAYKKETSLILSSIFSEIKV